MTTAPTPLAAGSPVESCARAGRRHTPPWVTVGSIVAVFVCVATILMYAAHRGQEQASPETLRRQATVEVARGHVVKATAINVSGPTR